MVRYVLGVWEQEWKIERSMAHADDWLAVSLSSEIKTQKLKGRIMSLTLH